MERELDFPNPIERSDLPVRRSRWKYVVGAAALLLVVGVAVLPQIVSSRIGRNLVKMRLESKYRGQAWLTSIKTSWRGPTTVGKFSLTDGEGRQIKFDSLESGVSLWGLLTGNFDLKDATITNLQAEYVVDYGDGTDTFDRLPQGYVPGLGIEPGAPKPAPPSLPKLSGNITLRNATLILTRGQVLGEKQYRVAYRSAKLSKINGTVRIESLDRPFECDLKGILEADELTDAGRFELKGMVGLGENGKLDAAKARSDLWLTMHDVPNGATRGVGSLGWVLLPVAPAEDYASMFGPTLTRVRMNIRAADGKLRLAEFEALGQTKAGKPTRVAGTPVIDLIANPKTVGVESRTTASVQMTRELSQRLAYLNPFLRDAAEGTGELDLTIDELSAPVLGSQQKMTARGSLAVKELLLVSGPMAASDAYPRDLTTQWQAIAGNAAATVKMNQPATPFEIVRGSVKCDWKPITLAGAPVMLAGPISLNGTLAMQAQLATPHGKMEASLGGTVERPMLEMAKPSVALQQQLDRNLATLRERKSEQLLEAKGRQVEAIIKGVDRINPAGTIPGQQPQWEKARWDDEGQK